MFGVKRLLSGANDAYLYINRHVVNFPTLKEHWAFSQKLYARPSMKQELGVISRYFSSSKLPNFDKFGPLVELKASVFEKYYDESRVANPIIILHGLLGCRENWASMARQLNRRLGRKVWTLDARNHGESPHSRFFSYEYMVVDTIYWMKQRDINKATIIGHSMGGRAAMMLAMRCPELVENLVVVDISPVAPSPNLLKVNQLLRDLKNLLLDRDYTLKEARRQTGVQLREKKYDEQLIAFIQSNMVENEWRTNWCWRFNLDTILETFEKRLLYFPIVTGPCFSRTLFLGGTESDYLIPYEERQIIKHFPYAEFNYIKGAGHWVHVDKPVDFLDAVVDFVSTEPNRQGEEFSIPPMGECVDLVYQEYNASPSQNKSNVPIVILHGLLGSKQNWHSMAIQLNSRLGRPVFTVDARNHGESPHTPEFTYKLMVCDLKRFLFENGILKAAFIGHSMGGRTAMMMTMYHPEIVESLVVVDISPCGNSPNMLGIKHLLHEIDSLRLDPRMSLSQARKEAAVQLRQTIQDERIIAFILTNLVENINFSAESNWRWKFNLHSIINNVENEIFMYPALRPNCFTPTLFIGGAESDYLKREEEPAISKVFPEAKFRYIEGAGHWVHAEKPNEFLSIVTEFLSVEQKLITSS